MTGVYPYRHRRPGVYATTTSTSGETVSSTFPKAPSGEIIVKPFQRKTGHPLKISAASGC